MWKLIYEVNKAKHKILKKHYYKDLYKINQHI